MKKKKTKLFIGITVLIAIVMSVGCGNDKPPITAPNSDNQKIVDDINNIIEDNLKDQVVKIKAINKDNESQIIGEIVRAKNLKELAKKVADQNIEYKLSKFRLRACGPNECACRGGCFACGPDCGPPGLSELKMIPDLFDRSRVVNPGPNGITLNVNRDVLEVNGQFSNFEDMSNFIDFLSKNNVRETLFVDVSVPR